MRRGLLVGVIVLGCAGPALAEPCPAGAKPMSRIELMFGLSRPGGRLIGEGEWQSFLAEEVTPRFPEGLTVLAGHGQWRNARRHVTREPMRLLLILHEPDAASDGSVEAIRSAFKLRFRQESVVRIDSAACASF